MGSFGLVRSGEAAQGAPARTARNGWMDKWILSRILHYFPVSSRFWEGMRMSAEATASRRDPLEMVVLLHISPMESERKRDELAVRLADLIRDISDGYGAVLDGRDRVVGFRGIGMRDANGHRDVQSVRKSELRVNRLKIVLIPPSARGNTDDVKARVSALMEKHGAGPFIHIESLQDAYRSIELKEHRPVFHSLIRAAVNADHLRLSEPEEFDRFACDIAFGPGGPRENTSFERAVVSGWLSSSLAAHGELVLGLRTHERDAVHCERQAVALPCAQKSVFDLPQSLLLSCRESVRAALSLGFTRPQKDPAFAEVIPFFLHPARKEVDARVTPPAEGAAWEGFLGAEALIQKELFALRAALGDVVGVAVHLRDSGDKELKRLAHSAALMALVGDAPAAFVARKLSESLARASPGKPEQMFTRFQVESMLADVLDEYDYHALGVPRREIESVLGSIFKNGGEVNAAKIWAGLRAAADEFAKGIAVGDALVESFSRDFEAEVLALAPSPFLKRLALAC